MDWQWSLPDRVAISITKRSGFEAYFEAHAIQTTDGWNIDGHGCQASFELTVEVVLYPEVDSVRLNANVLRLTESCVEGFRYAYRRHAHPADISAATGTCLDLSVTLWRNLSRQATGGD